MLFLLFSVMLFGLLLCGSGCLLGKFLGYSAPRNPLIYFWLGFFIVSTLSMLGSLFAPINVINLLVFIIIGTIGLFFLFREYKQSTIQYERAEKTIFVYVVVLTLLIIICFGAYTEWPGFAYDTDLYHAQTVRWYNEYGTPPGLGNLHSRLAFNSSWLSLAALFDNGIWDNRSAWIMPVLALLGGALYFLHELIFSRKNGIRLYAFCILVWLLLKIGERAGPALYYDTPVHILNAAIVLEAYYLFTGYNRNLSKKEIHVAANLLMLGVSAFMIKPIGAVSLLFSGVLTLFLLLRNTKRAVSSWFIIFTPALSAFSVWVIKNIFLSGYLLYPLPIFAAPLDWTMPFELAEINYKAVLAWARIPGPGSIQSLENGFLFWFRPWLIRNLNSNTFLLFAAFPSFFSIIIWFFIIRYNDIKKAIYFFIWALFSIVYWFLTAPDIRFGDGFFWVFLGAACLYAAPDIPHLAIADFWKNPKIRIIFFYFWGLCVICMIGYAALSSRRNLFTIGTIPSRPVKEYIVNTEPPFAIWIPDDERDDRTGNSPLPSAPGIPNNLQMREPGNPGKGFRPIRH